MQNEDDEIARYRGGTARLRDLDVAAAWQDILSKPDERTKAAEALGVGAADLDGLAKPPVVLTPGRPGITGGEIVVWIVAWLGTEVVLGSLKDLAKEELKKRVKKLWDEVLERAVRDRLKDSQGLGTRIDRD